MLFKCEETVIDHHLTISFRSAITKTYTQLAHKSKRGNFSMMHLHVIVAVKFYIFFILCVNPPLHTINAAMPLACTVMSGTSTSICDRT